MKTYDDAHMLLAAQIAHLDSLNIDPKGELTIGEIVDIVLAQPDGGDGNDKYSELRGTVKDIKEIAENCSSDDWRNWRIIEPCNKQNTSGLYGCLIDTGDGDAIISFRGSEAYDDQFLKDWVVADFGLLNNSLTFQQKDASDFTREVWDKYGGKYSNFSFAGHSLGGNLAEHSAITAPDAMRSRIVQSLNFDGPGFSDEYLARHADDINKSRDYLTHYQWSAVGSLLFHPSGIKNMIIDSADGSGDNPFENYGKRHVMTSAIFDAENPGKLKEANFVDPVAMVLGPVSKGLDFSLDGLDLMLTLSNPIMSLLRPSKILASIDNFQRWISDIAEGWGQFSQSLHNFFASSRVSGEFEVNLSMLSSFDLELETLEGRLNSIVDSIDDIQQSLKYESLSGSYYKTKLWMISNRLKEDDNKLDKSRQVLEQIKNEYSSSENVIADLFR